MFALNLGYKWSLATAVEPVRAIMFLPTGNHAERLRRTAVPEAQRVLFDPQLYLANLNPKTAAKTCARLATYPWFGTSGLPEFDSSTGKQTDWEKELRMKVKGCWPGVAPSAEAKVQAAAAAAISFQLELPCSHIILPTPLIAEREDEAETQALWLDAGLEQAQEQDVGQPLLATVAVSEAALNDAAFEENGFLDTIVDQVVSRDGLDGVYIVVAQTHAQHPFETSQKVCRAYLHLCEAFGQSTYDTVLPNFCDVFGLICTTVGATGVVTGQSAALRRLALSGFRDGGGGGKYLPHLYSHKVVAELRSETDLDVIVKKRLVTRIKDLTPHSQALFSELGRGGSAANLKSWAESHMNVAAAQRHFVHRLAKTTRDTLRLPLDERTDAVRDWVESATANDLFIKRRLKKAKLKGRFAPTEMWLDTLDEYSPEPGS